MAKLTSMRIIWAEQDNDITVKFWGQALSGPPRFVGLAVFRQPPFWKP